MILAWQNPGVSLYEYPVKWKSLRLLLFAAAACLSACSSIEYNSTNAPRMVVVVERTPFYMNGPAQGNGPDTSLVKGDVVQVLRKEIGYSYVRIEDGANGYVANEALKADTEPRPAPKSKPSPSPETQPAPAAAQPAPAAPTTEPSFRY